MIILAIYMGPTHITPLKLHQSPKPLAKSQGRKYRCRFAKISRQDLLTRKVDMNSDQKLASWWFQPIWKILVISQIGNLPQVGVKIKNIWNHQLVNSDQNSGVFKLEIISSSVKNHGCLDKEEDEPNLNKGWLLLQTIKKGSIIREIYQIYHAICLVSSLPKMGNLMTTAENPMRFLQVIPFVPCSAVVLPFKISLSFTNASKGGSSPSDPFKQGKLLEAPNCFRKKVGTWIS